ncbi:MAG: hypothetical protein R3217_03040 [Gammaproteobacteria bacterium]|nr:hypothetical protein [Gammaproteobacteria bacterium]
MISEVGKLPFVLALLLATSGVAAGEAIAADEPVEEPGATELAPVDEFIQGQLDALELSYDIDEDNDFRLIYKFDDGRSQAVFVRSQTYESSGIAMRDVWSYGYTHPTKYLPMELERELLFASYEGVMGGWAREGNAVVYMVKIRADAPAEMLEAAINEAIEQADELEAELAGDDRL